MKKLNIMLEDELLTPRSDPVPHGLQKQFPISNMKMIYGMLVAIVMVAFPWQAYPKGYWQVSYSLKDGANVISLPYMWTDKQGNAIEPVKYVQLFNNDVTVKVPWQANTYDVTWIWPAGGISSNKCYTTADSMALTQVGGVWESDMLGFAESQGGELEWQSGFLAPTLDGTLYYDVDLTTYYAGGAPLYPDDGSMDFQIVNGTCSELPGYLFATSSIYLDPVNGLMTADPYTGDVTSGMLEGVCPEPSVLALVGIGAIGLLARRRRAA